VTNPISRVVGAARELLRDQRARRPWLDHLVHAGGHYNRVQGDLLASGVTYYVFLALFPVLLLAASVAAFVLRGDLLLEEQLVRGIREAVPGSTGQDLAEEVERAIDRAATFGLIGLAGFLFVGLGATDKLRVGMDVVWRGRPDPPDFLADRLKDLGALLGLGAASLVSIALTTGATAASSRVLALLGVDEVPGYFLLTGAVAIALALAGDTLVFLWVLKWVPDNPAGPRQLLPAAVFGAVGFEVLKLVGNWYLTLIGHNVTAQTLGGFVGLIVWINVVVRFAFYTASWAATIPAVERARTGALGAPAQLTAPSEGSPATGPGRAVPQLRRGPLRRGPLRRGPLRRGPLRLGLRRLDLRRLGLLGIGALAGVTGSRLLPRLQARRGRGRVAEDG
jgi:membrane protein